MPRICTAMLVSTDDFAVKKRAPRTPMLNVTQTYPYSHCYFYLCRFAHHQAISIAHAIIDPKTLILSIMTSRPIVTIMSNVKENQPMTMALVPTPDLTEPLPKSCAMTDAATEAVCCHNTDTRTNIEAMKMMARATWETAREGKGLTSRSEPSESSSSCQPGKVARRMKQIKAKTMAIML